MRVTLREDERADLLAAQRSSRGVRQWRREQAVLLRADGMPRAAVAQALGCSQARGWNWTRAWREQGKLGVAEGAHRGAERRLDAQAQRVIEALWDERQPQAHGDAATGWTVPRHAHRAGPAGLAPERADAAADTAPLGLAMEAPPVCAGPA